MCRFLSHREKQTLELEEENGDDGYELFGLSSFMVALSLEMKGSRILKGYTADLQKQFRWEKSRVQSLKLSLKRTEAERDSLREGLKRAHNDLERFQTETNKLKEALKTCTNNQRTHEMHHEYHENQQLRLELGRKALIIKDLKDTLLFMFKSQEQGMYDLARKVEPHDRKDQFDLMLKKLIEIEATLQIVKTERDISQRFELELQAGLRMDHHRIKEVEEVTGKIMSTQRQIMHAHEEKLDSRDKEVKDLEETLCTIQSQLKTESKLSKHLKESDTRYHEIKKKLEQNRDHLNKTQIELGETKLALGFEIATRQDFETQSRIDKSRIHNLEEVVDHTIPFQYQRILELEEEAKWRDLKIKNAQKLLDSEQYKVDDKQSLREHIRVREEQMSYVRDQLEETLNKWKETEAKLNESKRVAYFKNQARQKLEDKVRENENTVKSLKESTGEVISSQKSMIQKLETELKDMHLKVGDLEETLENARLYVLDVKETSKISENKEEQLSVTRDQLQQALTALRETEAKLDDTRKERNDLQLNRQEFERKARESQLLLKEFKESSEAQVSLQKTIEHLQREVIIRELQVTNLEKTIDDTKTTHKRDRGKLFVKLKEKEDQVCELKGQLHKISVILDEKETEIGEVKSERDLEKHTKEHLEIQPTNTVIELKESRDKIVLTQNQKIQLEKVVERLGLKVKGQEELLDSTSINENEIFQLHKNLNEKENQISEMRSRVEQTLANMNERSKENDKMKTQIDSLQITKQDLERQKAEYMKLITVLKEEANKVPIKQQKIQDLEKIVQCRDQELKDTKTFSDNLRKEDCDMKKLKKDLVGIECQLSEKRDLLENTVAHLKKVEAELIKSESVRNVQLLTIQELKERTKQDEAQFRNLEEERNEKEHKNQLREREIEQRDLQLDKQKERLHGLQQDVSAKSNHLMEKENQISDLQDLLQKRLAKLKEVESEVNEIKIKRGIDQSAIVELEKKADINKKQLDASEKMIEQNTKSLNQRIKHLECEIELRNDSLSKLGDNLQHATAKLRETEAELEETKTRLSKAMGDKLTDNNPNIADLSDKNRPVKLAEKFAELYDNQWTDAYDILEKHLSSEQTTIDTLLEILMDAMSFCISHGQKQMEDFQNVLGFSNTREDRNVSTDVRKHFKDCRKAMTSTAIRNLYKMYMSHVKTSDNQKLRTSLEISSYVKECVDLCWLMVIQDPPVVFDTVAERGYKLNTDIYKPYTSSGTHVEYVVWPALLLHKGGPILAKGVAQGYGKKNI